MPAALAFTPAQASLGGLVLALAVAGKVHFVGKITGISGAIKGVVVGDRKPWRFAFLSGLALGGRLIKKLRPEFIVVSEVVPVWRAVAAGALVGTGTSLSNGCTSGHGLCGISRLSIRSIAATCTFMAAGAAVATATGTMKAMGFVTPATAPIAYQGPSPAFFTDVVVVAGSSFVAYAVINALKSALPARKDNAQDASTSGACVALEQAAELVSGLTFAAGLGLSGMTSAAKVAGFLDTPVVSPTWDASLMFVMGVALIPLTAVMHVVKGRAQDNAKPVLTKKYEIPSSSVVDARLLGGAALFGAGWGLYGACPGPALVQAAGVPNAHTLGFLAAMAAGQVAAEHMP